MDAVTPGLTTQEPKRSNKVVVAVLIFVLALAVFGAVFVYAGGIELIQPWLGGSPSTPSGGQPVAAPSVATSASASSSASELEVAKLTYAEQIESQANIDRLADGDIASFSVDKLDVKPTVAIVTITARFKDGTRAQGALRFVKSGESWYFTTISGLRAAATGGLADSVRQGSTISASVTADAKLAAVGVTTPDAGVLDTIIVQQKANQSVVRDLLAGEYKIYELGKPVVGSSTFTIPVTISSAAESPVKASIVLIAKTVEGKDRIFIVSFKRE